MNLFGKKESGGAQVPSIFQDQLETLADQAEIAETVDEQREINKSILGLIADNVSDISKAVSAKKGDEDEDEEDFDDEDDDESDDDEEIEEPPVKPFTKKLRKSISEFTDEEAEDVDAGPILKSIASQLKQANAISAESNKRILKSAARMSRLETRLDEFTSALNPILDYVQDGRDTTQGTPTGNAPAHGIVNKSLAANTGSGDPGTLPDQDAVTEVHGMTAMSIIKSVSDFMLENPHSERVSRNDFNKIGNVPLDKLPKSVIEVAAEARGIDISG